MEVCVDNLESALAAYDGGAIRIELCSDLNAGGLTPSIGLLNEIRKRLPKFIIYVMIRCRSGDFIYDDYDLCVMEEEIQLFSKYNVDGYVFGALNPNGTIHLEALKRLIKHVPNDKSMTYHRAFDFVSNWKQAIDQLVELGFKRILTSGLEKNAYYGRKLIRQMTEYANKRILIMPGCGIDIGNLETILTETGVTEFHASARIKRLSTMIYKNPNVNIDNDFDGVHVTDKEKVKMMVTIYNKVTKRL
ncbi:unnamed protein product [Didymodactylos carnosus]|uniref:Copper homeostasis protein cutC homolog n=1 Tax=Didymodactylos carnosus TaxID=1234261 RepID=A0A815B034_9BILA|nr:unnamed protein product [Didymodactylos carnosus]CAF1463836.1 unnamed protein product [Didymodactylos carnosus]CAF4047461.1 unnamed protein product [Didymodactylos carnosus]CAF4256750.1 unnamed protein product [Didymodactylos carnosus]